ncbi:MAG: transposase family protein [Propionibacteriaceae bacterium]|nr:transposase family protein [Propionibacteriaceae bacterium]
MRQRKAVLAGQVKRWRKATKAEKSVILDHIVAVNGWHRDHARKMMRLAVAGVDVNSPRKKRAPVHRYSQEVIDALVVCWAVLDGPSGKILQPALPALVPRLIACGDLDCTPNVETQLLAISAATIDRRLKPYRTGLAGSLKPRSLTRPGSLLKSSIPLKTWHEWDDRIPGFIEIDLVGHDGGDNNGEFHFSLDAVDVATGWTETISVKSKGERIITQAISDLRLLFPFPILGIHSDNGSEFINWHLLHWCENNQVTFTRGRANHSNDQAHIEQRNWTRVRRNVGYYRYDTPRELALLNQLWPLVSVLTNLYTPQQRLQSKTRQGAKVTKIYDTPASPATRLLRDHPGSINTTDTKLLQQQLAQTNPAQLRRDIDLIQRNLLELARRRGATTRRAKRNHIYLSKTKTIRASSHESTNQTKRAI